MTKGISSRTPQARDDLHSRLTQGKGGGNPLPETDRSFMERRFGADFRGVRVHTGSNAVQLNRELNAQAFAHGKDIYFGAGRYSPTTISGQRLLAHELTHVVQQGIVTTLVGQRDDRAGMSANPGGGVVAKSEEGSLSFLTHREPIWLGDAQCTRSRTQAANNTARTARARLLVAGGAVHLRSGVKCKPDTDTLFAHKRVHAVQQWRGIKPGLLRKPDGEQSSVEGYFQDLNGRSMADMLRVLSESGAKVVTEMYGHLYEARGVYVERIRIAMQAILMRGRPSTFKQNNQSVLKALPIDQRKELLCEVGGGGSKPKKTCPPPKGSGKHPSEVSQTLMSRLMGKFVKRDGDPGEGCRLTPYLAGKTEKFCTIGYDHQMRRCPVKKKNSGRRYCSCSKSITKHKAEQLLRLVDVRVAANYVNNQVHVDLNQAQFDALVDLTLHCGHLPCKLRTAIKSYWCTNEGKNYVRGLYLKSCLTPVRFSKVFARRRKYRVWPWICRP